MQKNLGAARIFSFGVGSSVNRHLLAGMARAGRGAVAFVGLQDAEVDPACGINVVRGDPADCRADVAMSIAAALSGGQTAALLIRRYSE